MCIQEGRYGGRYGVTEGADRSYMYIPGATPSSGPSHSPAAAPRGSPPSSPESVHRYGRRRAKTSDKALSGGGGGRGAGGEGRGACVPEPRGRCTPRLQTQYQLVLLSCTTVIGSRTSSRCSCGSSSAAVKFFPPSKEHSTRQIPRPAPLHAIPRSVMLDTPLAPERTVLVLGSQRMLCTCGQRFHRDLVLIGL